MLFSWLVIRIELLRKNHAITCVQLTLSDDVVRFNKFLELPTRILHEHKLKLTGISERYNSLITIDFSGEYVQFFIIT